MKPPTPNTPDPMDTRETKDKYCTHAIRHRFTQACMICGQVPGKCQNEFGPCVEHCGQCTDPVAAHPASPAAEPDGLTRLHALLEADLLQQTPEQLRGLVRELSRQNVALRAAYPAPPTAAGGAAEAVGLSPERLRELQALRDDVRRKLQGPAHANSAARTLIGYLRVECLLDEGDELQREVARLQERNAMLHGEVDDARWDARELREQVRGEFRQLLQGLPLRPDGSSYNDESRDVAESDYLKLIAAAYARVFPEAPEAAGPEAGPAEAAGSTNEGCGL